MKEAKVEGTLGKYLWQCSLGQGVDVRGIVGSLADEGYRIYHKDEVDAMLKALDNIAGYPTYEPAAQELQRIASAVLKLTGKGTN